VELGRRLRRARYRALSVVEDLRDVRRVHAGGIGAARPHVRILFVCLGNTCRSPLAEAILRSRLASRGIDDVQVASAGTSERTRGLGADPRARRVARTHEIDLRRHRARPFRAEDFEGFDRIVVFDRENLGEVLAQARTEAERAKVSLLVADAEVSDPVAEGAAAFERTYAEIAAACERLVDELADERR
jgi:protein-tyrosine phosphatase